MSCNDIIKHALAKKRKEGAGVTTTTGIEELTSSPFLRAYTSYHQMEAQQARETIQAIRQMDQNQVCADLVGVLATLPEQDYIYNGFSVLAELKSASALKHYRYFKRHKDDMKPEQWQAYILGFAHLANQFPGDPQAEYVLDEIADDLTVDTAQSFVHGLNPTEYHRMRGSFVQRVKGLNKEAKLSLQFAAGIIGRDEPLTDDERRIGLFTFMQYDYGNSLTDFLLQTNTPKTTALLQRAVTPDTPGIYQTFQADPHFWPAILRELRQRGIDVRPNADVYTKNMLKCTGSEQELYDHLESETLDVVCDFASDEKAFSVFRDLRQNFFSLQSEIHGLMDTNHWHGGEKMDAICASYVRLANRFAGTEPEAREELAHIARESHNAQLARLAMEGLAQTEEGRQAMREIAIMPDPPDDYFHNRRLKANKRSAAEKLQTFGVSIEE